MSTSSILTEIRKIPPVTRFLCGSTLAVSIPLLLGILNPYLVVFHWSAIANRFQIWRFFTSFFIGSGGIGFLFDFVMLYRYSDQLESVHFPNRSPDYAWQLLFAGATILTLTAPLQTLVHMQPLLITLLTLCSKLSPPGAQTSIMGLITIPVEYLPYAMVGFELLRAGPSGAARAVAGVIVGWTWWICVWGSDGRGSGVLAGLETAPAWLRRIVPDSSDLPANVAGVHVVEPRRRAGEDAAPGTRAAPYNWGTGRRLGAN